MNGQHIQSAQVENQEHLNRPTPHPIQFGQACHDFGIPQLVALLQGGQGSRGSLFCDSKDVIGFGSRQARRSKTFQVHGHYLFCRRKMPIAKQRLKAAQIGICCVAV
jgi:hypothetical protein